MFTPKKFNYNKSFLIAKIMNYWNNIPVTFWRNFFITIELIFIPK